MRESPEAERARMVETQLRRRGIRDARVLDAMRRTPRELFVPEAGRRSAYDDAPVSIGFGQTISQPYMTAFMCQALELQGNEKVLDVGAGSGYHAAVLGALAAEVYSIELIPELARMAQANLRAAGCAANVHVIAGDGSRGCPEHAPFDAISVAAGAPDVPPSLEEQLAVPGRLVLPVGTLAEQGLLLVEKTPEGIRRKQIALCRFVPLRGSEGWPREEDS